MKPDTEQAEAEKPDTAKADTEKSGAEKSGTEKPVSERPVSEQSGAAKPGSAKPGAEKPGAEKPGNDKAGAEKAASEKPVAGKSSAKKPGTANPVPGKPDPKALEEEKPLGLLSRFSYGLTVMLFFAVFAALAIAPRVLHKVKSGELGVLYRLFSGTDLTRTYGEGLQLISPLDELFIYDTRVQEFTRSVDVLSFNGLSVHVSLSCRYVLIRDELPALHQEVGPEYETKMILPVLLSSVREVIGTYRPEELYTTHSATIQEEINRVAQEGMTGRHVTFLPILVSSISLPPQVNTAIEDKLRQQQEAQSYEFRLVREAQEKERRRIEGEGINQQLEIVGRQLTPPVLKWLHIQAMQALALSDNSKVLVMDSETKPVVQYPLQLQESGRSQRASSSSDTTEEKKEETPGEDLPEKDASIGALGAGTLGTEALGAGILNSDALEKQVLEKAGLNKDLDSAVTTPLRSLLKTGASGRTNDSQSGKNK